MPLATATPAAVQVGPGILYVAPIGTTEPTTLSGTLPSANWIGLGYTDQGSEFSFARTSENIEVAEELSPVRIIVTGEVDTVTFALAEMTARNLAVAFNGGTISSPTSGYVTFEPPSLGAEERLMLVWQSAANDERWLFRRVLQTGTLAIPRRKGNAKAIIPCVFTCEIPTDNSTNFKAWLPASFPSTDPH